MDNSIIVAIISGVFSVVAAALGSYLGTKSFEETTSYIRSLDGWSRQLYLCAWVSFVFCLLGACTLIVVCLVAAYFAYGPIGFSLSLTVTGALLCAFFFFLFKKVAK